MRRLIIASSRVGSVVAHENRSASGHPRTERHTSTTAANSVRQRQTRPHTSSTGQGLTLYLVEKDKQGKRPATGAARRSGEPPHHTAKPTAGAGVAKPPFRRLGRPSAPTRKLQADLRGHVRSTYDETQPGQTKGQGPRRRLDQLVHGAPQAARKIDTT